MNSPPDEPGNGSGEEQPFERLSTRQASNPAQAIHDASLIPFSPWREAAEGVKELAKEGGERGRLRVNRSKSREQIPFRYYAVHDDLRVGQMLYKYDHTDHCEVK